LRATADQPSDKRPEIWVVSELGGHPLEAVPESLFHSLASAPALALVEEHVAPGGFGQQFLHTLALLGKRVPPLLHAHAQGYPSGRYGSQLWHRLECGLDVASILASLTGRVGATKNGT
jgi:transketolase